MNIKKFNIGFDSRSGKILFDLDVDGITCSGGVDVRKSEDLTDLLYAIEDGCQRLRRKIGTKDAEQGTILASGVKSPKVPVVPGKTYRSKEGNLLQCDRVAYNGVYFINLETRVRFMAHGLVMHDDSSLSWEYTTNERRVQL